MPPAVWPKPPTAPELLGDGASPALLPDLLRPAETHGGSNNIFDQSGGTQLGEIYTYLGGDGVTYDEYWVLYDIAGWHGRLHGTYAPAVYIEHVDSSIDDWDTVRAALKQVNGSSSWRWFQVTYTFESVPSSLDTSPDSPALTVKIAGDVVGRVVHVHGDSGDYTQHWALDANFTTPSDGAAFRMDSLSVNHPPSWVLGLPNANRYVELNWTSEAAL